MSFSAGSGANKRVTIEFIGDDSKLTAALNRVNSNLKTTMQTGSTAVNSIGVQFQKSATQAEVFTGSLQQMNTTSAQFTGALGNMSTSTKSTTTEMGALNNAMKETNTFSGSVVSGMGKTTDSVGKLGDAGEKTGGKMSKLKEVFSGNRGLIYSMGTIFGTVTGVVAELELLKDANGQVAEATEKLNKLQAEGKQGTTEYSQAQQALEKAQRFLSFTTRNLFLATANFVPELLLLATNLSKSEGLAGKLGGAFGRLRGNTTGVGGAIASMGTAAGTSGLALAGMIGIVAGGAIALGAFVYMLSKANEEFQKISNADFSKMTSALGALSDPKAAEQIGITADEMDILAKAGFGPLQIAFDEFFNKGENVRKKLQELGLMTADGTKIDIKAAKEKGLLTNAQSQLAKTIEDTRDPMLKNNGIWIDFTNTGVKVAATQKQIIDGLKGTVSQFTDYSGVVDQTNAVIDAFEDSVRNGTIAENDINAAVEAGTKALVDAGLITEEQKVKIDKLSESHLHTYVPAVKEATEKQKTFAETMGEGGTSVSRFGDAIKNVPPSIRAAGQTYAEFLDELHQGIPAQEQLRLQLVELAQKNYPEIKNAMSLSTEQLKEQIIAAEKARLGIKNYGDATEDVTKQIQDMDNKISDVSNTYQVHLNPALIKTEKQLGDVKDALEAQKKALEELQDASDLFDMKPFKIKFEGDDAFTKLIEGLSGKTKKVITIGVKMESLDNELSKLLTDMAKATLKIPVGFEANDKSADEFIKDSVKMINKAFKKAKVPKSPEWTKITNDLLKIEKEPDSWAKLKTYFQSDDFLAAIKKLTPEQKNVLAEMFKGMSLTPEQRKQIGDAIGVDLGTGVSGGVTTGVGGAYTAIDSVVKRIQDLPTVVAGLPKAMLELNNTDAIKLIDAVVKRWQSAQTTIEKIKPKLSANNTDAFKIIDAVVKRWNSASKTISKEKPKLDANNTEAFKAIDAVVKRWEGAKKQLESKPKLSAGSHMTISDVSGFNANDNAHVSSGSGMMNITVINTDEYGERKKKKFRAEMGRGSFVFGA